jgi:hypothetical protein
MENCGEISSKFLKYYLYEFWNEFGDKRVKRFKLFGNGPYILLIILLTYLVLVKIVVPYFMKSREPLKIVSIIVLHNILLVLANGFYFTYELRSLNYGKELISFEIPSDEQFSPEIEHEMKIIHFYVITKIIDLFDTIFFALRKKSNQISFLHLYHHILILGLSWIAFWYRFNMKPNKLFILINSFIHTLMYSYYTLSTMGPKVHKYLWWKKYLTQLQLAQFVVLAIYGVMIKLLGIPYPNILYYFAQIQTPIFFYMFYNFYIKSYIDIKPKKYL